MKKVLLILKNNLFNQRSFIALLCVSMAFASCKKEDDDSSPTNNNNSSSNDPPISTPKDANGTLVAVESATVIDIPGFGQQEIPFYTAIAVFYDDPTAGTFIPAGSVMCEGEELTKQSNNTYIHMPSQTNPSGITFDSPIEWEVSGAGTVPTISASVSIGFASVSAISSDSLIDRTKDYTLMSNVSSADSVIWMIGELYHITGNQNSYTFTKDELSTLPAGASIAQVVGYRYQVNTTDGKNYYYINEKIKNKQVGLQ